VRTGSDRGCTGSHDRERRTIIRAIGPVWDGNEVWLIAAGGTLFFAFPTLYASGFSGFYLPLIIVLWLLMIRGLSIELRGHINDPMWASFWDAAFFVGMLTSTVLGVYPKVLPAVDPANYLTVQNASASTYGMAVGLVWWSIGMVLAVVYFTVIYRLFRGKVRL
jgi:cytochrome bd-type quinol oxidase subunit 2